MNRLVTTRSIARRTFGGGRTRLAAGLWAILVATSCGHAARTDGDPVAPPANADVVASVQAEPTALERAIEHYRATGDWEPLRREVDARPDDPSIDLWREVVALRRYDAWIEARVEAEDGMRPLGSEGALAALAARYPGTYAARSASVALDVEMVGELTRAPIRDEVVAFLDGSDACFEALPDASPTRFRAGFEEAVRQAFGQALLESGCADNMGYCNWWVARFPDDPVTAHVRAQVKDVWWKRGHPRWTGRNHAHCAWKCARHCRERAAPLDDGCWAPCYARCPGAVLTDSK